MSVLSVTYENSLDLEVASRVPYPRANFAERTYRCCRITWGCRYIWHFPLPPFFHIQFIKILKPNLWTAVTR